MEFFNKTDADFIQQNQIESLEKEKIENKIIGSFRLKTGCKLFSIRLEDEFIEPVEFEGDSSINPFDGVVIERRQFCFSDKYAYVQAINEKNAMRKFKRAILEKKYELLEDFSEKEYQSICLF